MDASAQNNQSAAESLAPETDFKINIFRGSGLSIYEHAPEKTVRYACPQLRNPVRRGHRFRCKADSIPVIADSS